MTQFIIFHRRQTNRAMNGGKTRQIEECKGNRFTRILLTTTMVTTAIARCSHRSRGLTQSHLVLTGSMEVSVQGLLLHTQTLASLLVKTQVLDRKDWIFFINLHPKCLEASIAPG